MYVPAEIYHRFRTKPSPKPAHGLCLSLLDGHLIVLQGIQNPSICELGPRLLACAEYFACCSGVGIVGPYDVLMKGPFLSGRRISYVPKWALTRPHSPSLTLFGSLLLLLSLELAWGVGQTKIAAKKTT